LTTLRVDRLRVGWLREGYRESRRYSRDTYPESNITKYTSIQRLSGGAGLAQHLGNHVALALHLLRVCLRTRTLLFCVQFCVQRVEFRVWELGFRVWG